MVSRADGGPRGRNTHLLQPEPADELRHQGEGRRQLPEALPRLHGQLCTPPVRADLLPHAVRLHARRGDGQLFRW